MNYLLNKRNQTFMSVIIIIETVIPNCRKRRNTYYTLKKICTIQRFILRKFIYNAVINLNSRKIRTIPDYTSFNEQLNLLKFRF